MAQQSRQYHWDKRKRRYVQLQPGEQLRGGKRQKRDAAGPGGGKPAEPGALYKKWAKAHGARVAAVGQAEDREATKLGSGVADRCVIALRRGRGGFRWRPVMRCLLAWMPQQGARASQG